MKIEADEEKCIGAGQCVLTAPSLFDQREEDGVVIVLNDTPPASEVADAENAVALCPAAALLIRS